MSMRIALSVLLAAGFGFAGRPGTGAPAAFVSAQAETQAPKRQPDIHYVPTPPAVVDGMLKLAEVTSADVVYDLGSGDGRIVIAAAKTYGARGVGIDLDPILVVRARKNAADAGVADKVTFIEGDIFEEDLSQATVVTLYLLSAINEKLRPKLLRELKPGARIVSHWFPMGDWKPDRLESIEKRPVWFWRVPER